MKNLNNYIIEKFKINKDIKNPEDNEEAPKEGTTCYDIGGNPHKIIDFTNLNDRQYVNYLIDSDEMIDSEEKNDLKRWIKNGHYDDEYNWCVLVDQHQGSNYFAFWGTDECDFPIVHYSLKT